MHIYIVLICSDNIEIHSKRRHVDYLKDVIIILRLDQLSMICACHAAEYDVSACHAAAFDVSACRTAGCWREAR